MSSVSSYPEGQESFVITRPIRPTPNATHFNPGTRGVGGRKLPDESQATYERAFGRADSLDTFTKMVVPATEEGRMQLKQAGKLVGLKITLGGRTCRLDRIGFGLDKVLRLALTKDGHQVPSTLFKFRRHKSKGELVGTFRPVLGITKSIILWRSAAKHFSTMLVCNTPNMPPIYREDSVQVWTDEAIAVLLQDRLKAQPETYSTITTTLNRLRDENAIKFGRGRQFTRRDVANKWRGMFPGKDDTNDAIAYLRQLEVDWPGTKVKVNATGLWISQLPPVYLHHPNTHTPPPTQAQTTPQKRP